MDSQPILWQIVLQVVLIGLNAVFACAEIAVISMNDNKLEQLASQGDKRAVRLARLTSQPARFLATIQVAITLSGFLGSAFAAENFSDILVTWLVGLGVAVPVATLDAIAVVVITLILSYFTLVFGELVPKRLAMKKAEALALSMSAMITVISKLFAPIVGVLTASTNCILRLCGIDPNAEDEAVSEEEIRMMVDAGSKKGVIDPEEKKIIDNLFEFDDLLVGECVTHRTKLCILWMDETPEEWERTIYESDYSLYPVCEDTADKVVGILSAKDYFKLKERTKEAVLGQAVKQPLFVAENSFADVVFRQMKKSHNRLAVVLDEYGGVLGIVTMNDLLEELVGDLEDSLILDGEDEEVQKLDDGSWSVKGSASLEDVAKILHITLPEEEYETFGGYVFALHGYIPEDGEQFELVTDQMSVQALKISGHRLAQAIVRPKRAHEDPSCAPAS